MSLALATAAAAALGLPRWVWIATLIVAVVLGIYALADQFVLAPRRHAAIRKALERTQFLHLTGSLTVAWLFDVFREDPTDTGLRRAQGIVAKWAADVADTLSIAAPHKRFAFLNDQGGPLPAYRGLTREQAEIVGLLERHLARLANVIEEVSEAHRP